jgi:hypothetical protein
MQVAAERVRTTYTPVQGFDRMGRVHSKHIRLLLFVNALRSGTATFGEDISLTTVCALLLCTKKRPEALDKLIIHRK